MTLHITTPTALFLNHTVKVVTAFVMSHAQVIACISDVLEKLSKSLLSHQTGLDVMKLGLSQQKIR